MKHNVIDRDRILIPPNWDSWGKIRVLREGFDVESISNEWGSIIDTPASDSPDTKSDNASEVDVVGNQGFSRTEGCEFGSLLAYEETIQDPKKYSIPLDQGNTTRRLDIQVASTQEFLANHLEAIERMKLEAEQGQIGRDRSINSSSSGIKQDHTNNITEEGGRVNDHIGPVQFNVGGIQVDAEDVLKRLKDREQEETPNRELINTPITDGKVQNEALANFFAGLMKRGGSNSPRPNPG